MGKAGPKPKGKLIVLETAEVEAPKPFKDMSKEAKAIWERVVSAYANDYFKPHHWGQLRTYCEAEAGYNRAVSEIEKSGAVVEQKNGVMKRSPWCNERDACSQVMATFVTKLGIAKNATAVSRSKAAEGSAKPKSKREGLMFNG
jgi:P27 family predicted phage terminase small subunit